MAEFTKKTTANGTIQYRNVTENKPVAKDKLSEELLARLDAAPEGTKVPESAEVEGELAPQATGLDTETVVLDRNILINGKVYKAGENRVSEDLAKDLRRINSAHTEYERNLIRSRDHSSGGDGTRPQDVREV